MREGPVQATVAGSSNAAIGLPAAWEILSAGGSALDAVEAAARIVEDDEADHGVGYAGLPNLLGEVELDASIMDGARRRVGAVGALRGFRHPVSVARSVMERLPHTFLVGEGAARFAAEIGMEPEDLLTDEVKRIWRQGLEGELPRSSAFRETLTRLMSPVADPGHALGTVNFLARDTDGHLACAVSTSGWPWKYPGRIGDSPVIGAGTYADDRYGAVGCTGMGELSMRAGLARDLIARLAAGADLTTAGRRALADLAPMAAEFPDSAVVNVVALGSNGQAAGFSSHPGGFYVVMRDGDTEPRRCPNVHVEWPGVNPQTTFMSNLVEALPADPPEQHT